MLSSLFYIANIPFPRIFYYNISESQSITTVKQIFQFCHHAVYLLALVVKRANLCNWEHLDLQILYRFWSNLSKKISHGALICFLLFYILLVQSKHKNIKKRSSAAWCLQIVMLLQTDIRSKDNWWFGGPIWITVSRSY